MRGNPYARGPDRSKSRSKRQRDQARRLARSPHHQRLRCRLRRIESQKAKRRKEGHVTALMESYVLRRQKARAAEKGKTTSPSDTARSRKPRAPS